MKTGIIVGASALGNEKEYLKDLIHGFKRKNMDLFIIAADGGIEFFYNMDYAPDHWIGDMDSAGNRFDADMLQKKFPSMKVDTCSPVKDVTDMEMAVTELASMGCEDIHCFGGLGGKRNSHTFANVALMRRMTSEKVKITFYGEDTRMFILKDHMSVSYDQDKTGFLSVLSLSDKSEGVSIKGLFYEYEGTLYGDNALGVSNEFCGRQSKVFVEKGTLLIIEENKQ